MAQATVRQDKDANATLDYTFDWSDFVDADTDTISSATVSATPSGIAVANVSATNSTVRCYISGGTEGTTYVVISHIWTAGGRQEDKTLELTVTNIPSGSHGFVAETGSAATNSNSYATLAAANTYHASHLYATTWTQANDATKEKALMMATRLLDEQILWQGERVSQDQALQWPRYNTYDRSGWAIDGDVIPQELINATAEFARLLIAEDRTAEPDTYGFTRIKVGSIDLEVDKNDRRQIVPAHVLRSIAHLGRPARQGTVSLVRT